MTKSDEFRWRNSVQALYPHIKIGLSSLKPPFFSSLLGEVSTVALTKRVELLLDPEQYAQLEETARARRESVGALIRRALAREYLLPMREQKRAALERLLQQEINFGSWRRAKKDIGKEAWFIYV